MKVSDLTINKTKIRLLFQERILPISWSLEEIFFAELSFFFLTFLWLWWRRLKF